MTSKQRAYLRSLASTMDPIFQIGKASVTPEITTAIEEAEMIFVCRKLYAQDMKPECFIDVECDTKNYPTKDYHTMYIAEITQVLVK